MHEDPGATSEQGRWRPAGSSTVAFEETAVFQKEMRRKWNRTILEHFATCPDPWFRAVAAAHPKTTRKTRARLVGDADPVVARLATIAAPTPSQGDAAAVIGPRDRAPARIRAVGREVDAPVRAVAADRSLTAEQHAIVAHPPERTALVQAFAGTGKTSTLIAYAQVWSHAPALYLAFNKAIAVEASARFPKHVEARTAHSLAYRALGVGTHRDRLTNHLRARDLHAALVAVGVTDPSSAMVRELRHTLRRYLIGDEPGAEVHRPARFDDVGGAEVIVAAVEALMRFEDSSLSFTHDVYLKRMALFDYVPPGVSYLMVDEAQDLNPVLIGWLRRTGLPLVIVGDPWQSIYAFRGAVSAMEAFDGPTYPLTQSWRFGADLARLATHLLRNVSKPPRVAVRGHPTRVTRLAPATRAAGRRRLVLGRTNAGVFEALLAGNEPFHVEGGFDAFARPLLAAARLKHDGVVLESSSGFDYASWEDLVTEAEAGDPDAGRLVTLVDRFGPELPRLLQALGRRQVPANQAVVHVSTAHKAKGLEADEVEMLGDFPSLASLNPIVLRDGRTLGPTDPVERDQEIHLLYVAATRAKSVLFAPDWLLAEHARAVEAGP